MAKGLGTLCSFARDQGHAVAVSFLNHRLLHAVAEDSIFSFAVFCVELLELLPLCDVMLFLCLKPAIKAGHMFEGSMPLIDLLFCRVRMETFTVCSSQWLKVVQELL